MKRFCSKKKARIGPFFILVLSLLFSSHDACAQHVHVDSAYFRGKGADVSSLSFNDATGESAEYVLIYNVGKDMFLNAGGYWGTRTTTFTVGLPLMLIKNSNGTYRIRGPFNNTQNGTGNFLGMVEDVNGKRGVYYDRGTSNGVDWIFEKDEGASQVDDVVYRIKTNYTHNGLNKDYILYSNETMDIGVFTEGNENLVRALNDTDLENKTRDDIYSRWKIVTVGQMMSLFDTTYDSHNPSDATFLLRAQNFNRKNVYNGTDAEEQQSGWHKDGNFSYTCGFRGELEGYNNPDDQRYGMFYCGGIRGGKRSEKLYQTVDITHSGWYRVDCEGLFYNADENKKASARLYAKVVGDSEPNSAGNAYVDLLPKSYAEPYNGVMLNEDRFINNDGIVSSKLEASIMFYNKCYSNHLLIYVNIPDGTAKTLELGIEITGDMDDDDFVFFDDFQLKYLGESFALDEGNTDFHNDMGDDDMEYKNRVMILKRTLATDRWNSICLPVNLTKEQFTTAFFPNSMLAKLRDSSQSGIIEFQTVDLGPSKPNDHIALHAGQCYLIKPGYQGRTDTEEIEIGDKNRTRIKAPYYIIDRVSLTKKNVEEDLNVSNVYRFVDNKDLEGSEKMDGYYTISGADYTQCKLRVYGTFQKLTGENRVPSASYTFVDGKLYHLPNNYSQKGFSCWIEDGHQVENNTTDRHPLSFSTYINGIHDSATSIDGMTVDMRDDTNDVIYNIYGQVVSRGTVPLGRMSKGIYIVRGKKVIIK